MSERSNLKLILLHSIITDDNEFINSLKNDNTQIIHINTNSRIEELDQYINNYNISHLTFIYHYPGYLSIPFFDYNLRDGSNNIIDDISSNLVENSYQYMNNNIVQLIKNINNPNLIIDLLSCNLNKDTFKNEMDKIENELNVNIRYSVDQTGNNPEGNWILESDNIDIKDLYFTEEINNWNRVLNSARTPSVIASNLSNYFNWDGNTLTLLENINWQSVMSSVGWSTTDFIQLSDNQIFDGQNNTIDLGSNTISGLITSTGTSIDNAPIIKNLGVLNGNINDNTGYIIRKEQSFFRINNCHSTGSISSYGGGGICGIKPGLNGHSIISNCYTIGNITGNYSGGICGIRAGEYGICNINNSYTTGNITSTGCGGIFGSSSAAYGECNISNCYSTGNISGTDSGGICGPAAGRYGGICNITSCYSVGTISNNAGGITGKYMQTGCNITNTYSNNSNNTGGTITGDDTISSNGNYDLSTLENYSGIGNLGIGFIISFLDNYKYPLLRSNIINGIITYDEPNNTIYLNKSVDYDRLELGLSHNQTFTNFILIDNQIFDGKNNTIDLTGITSFEGLFEIQSSSLETGPLIKNLGVLGGKTYPDSNTIRSSGFILRISQQNYKVDNCYSTGIISNHGGGICGTRNRNFIISNCYSTGNILSNSAGGITGYKCVGDIINCYSTGTIGDYSGGIAGADPGNYGNNDDPNLADTRGICNIISCYSTGAISGSYSGGISGAYAAVHGSTVNISNCYSSGNISGTQSGGICGYYSGHDGGIVTINNCYSSGSISGSSSGGITGYRTQSGVEIINCYSNNSSNNGGTITGNGSSLSGNYSLSNLNNYSGIGNLGDEYIVSILNNHVYPLLKSNIVNGIITYDASNNTIYLNKDVEYDRLKLGLNHNGTFTHFTVENNKTFDGQNNTIDLGSNTIYGLFASSGTSVENAPLIKNLGVLNGNLNTKAGYIMRSNQHYFKIHNCYSTGYISHHCGGIVGYNCGQSGQFIVTNSYSTGNIGSSSDSHAGGISGLFTNNCIIENCYTTGIIGYRSGGIIGGDSNNYGGINIINNCYSTGNISGNDSGGILGHYAGLNSNSSCTINNCYSTGIISGEFAGGITGNDTKRTTINNCYSIGNITGSNAGGITGNKSNSTTSFTNCYSKNSNNTGGTITGNGSPLNGNYPISNLSNYSGIENLGDEFTISFLNNYEYPVLKTNLSAGLITSTSTEITLNNTISFDILSLGLDHNNEFSYFIPNQGQNIVNNDNYIILSSNTNTNILNNKNILNYDNLLIYYNIEILNLYGFNSIKYGVLLSSENNYLHSNSINGLTNINQWGSNANNEWTIELIFKPLDNTNDSYIIDFGNKPAIIYDCNINKIKLYDISNSDLSNNLCIDVPQENIYHHYSFVGSSGSIKLYRDGILINNISNNISFNFKENDIINIGKSSTNNGNIDIYLIRIWTITRTQQDIQYYAYNILDVSVLDNSELLLNMIFNENYRTIENEKYIYNNISNIYYDLYFTLENKFVDNSIPTISDISFNIQFREESVYTLDINSYNVDISYNSLIYYIDNVDISNIVTPTISNIGNIYGNLININLDLLEINDNNIVELYLNYYASDGFNVSDDKTMILRINKEYYIDANEDFNIDITMDEDTSSSITISRTNLLTNIDLSFSDLSFNILNTNYEEFNNDIINIDISSIDTDSITYNINTIADKNGLVQGYIRINYNLYDDIIISDISFNINVLNVNDTISWNTNKLNSISFNEDSSLNIIIDINDISSADLINNNISFNNLIFDISGLDSSLLNVSSQFVDDTYVITLEGKPDLYGFTSGTIKVTHPDVESYTSIENINVTINNVYEEIIYRNNDLINLTFLEDSSLNYRININDIENKDISNNEISFNDISFNITGINEELLEISGEYDSSGYLFTFVGKENKHGITTGILNMIHPLDNNIKTTKEIQINITKQPDPIEFINSEVSFNFDEDTSFNYVISSSDISSVDLTNNDINFNELIIDISGLDSNLLSVSGEFIDNTYVFTFTGKLDKNGSTEGIITITHPNELSYKSTQIINLTIENLPEIITFKNKDLINITFLEDEYNEFRLNVDDIISKDISFNEISFNDLSFNISGLDDDLLYIFGEHDISGYLFSFVGKENKNGTTIGTLEVIHPNDNNIKDSREIRINILSQADLIEFINKDDVNISFYEESGYSYVINTSDISSVDIINKNIVLGDLIVDISGLDSNLVNYYIVLGDDIISINFKGLLDQYGSTSGIITLTHPLDSTITTSKIINISVTDVPEYIDNNVYTDTLTNIDTDGIISKETILDKIDLGDYILTIKLHKEDSKGKYTVGIPYTENVTISQISIQDGISNINDYIKSYNEEIANVNLEFDLDLVTYSDISYINVTMTNNTTSYVYTKTKYIDNSNVLIELKDISFGNYTIKMEIFDNEDYYSLKPEVFNKVVNQMNNINLYSNNILTKVLSYNDTITNIKTSFYLDIEKYPFETGIYELSGVNVSEIFRTTLTRDSSNIEIITNNVPYGEYKVFLDFYDASGLHITPKYESTIITNIPLFSKYRILTLDTPNTIENYEYRLHLTNNELLLKEINENSIRFYNNSDESELKYFVEKYDANSEIIIWLKLPLNIQTIKMNYETNINSKSNGRDVFKYFDDFNNNDLNEWAINGGNYSYNDGKLLLTNSNSKIELTNIELSNNSYIEIKSKTRSLNNSGYSVFDISNQDIIAEDNDYMIKEIDTIYNSVTSAFALYKLVDTYNGPIVKVRNGNNNELLDFYYSIDNSELQNSSGVSLIGWLNGGTGYIDTLYDQSSKGCDIYQTSYSNQPKIENNEIVFSGSQWLQRVLNDGVMPLEQGDDTFTFITRWKTTSSNSVQRIIDIGDQSIISYQRASIITYNSTYGFAGQNHDSFRNAVHNGVNNYNNTIMVINDNNSVASESMIIYHDKTKVYKTLIPYNIDENKLNISNNVFVVGRKNNISEYFIGTIENLMILNIDITTDNTDEEMKNFVNNYNDNNKLRYTNKIGLTRVSLINKSPEYQVLLDNSLNDTNYNINKIINKDVVYQVSINSNVLLESAIHNSDGLLFGIDDTTLPDVGQTLTNWKNVTGDNLYNFDISETNSYPVVTSYNNIKTALFSYNDLRTPDDNKTDSYEYSVMFVARITPGNGSNRVLSTESYNWLHGFYGSGFNGYYYGGWISSSEMSQFGNYDDKSEFHIFTSSVSKNNNLTKVTRNGTIYNHNIYSTMPRDWVLGGRGQYNEQSYAEIASLYVWDRALTDEEILSYESLLAKKYKIYSPFWSGPEALSNKIIVYDFNNNNEVFNNRFSRLQLLNNDRSSLNYSLYLNNNSNSNELLDVEYDWIRFRNIYDNNDYGISVGNLITTSILTNITNEVLLYTDEIANIKVIFNIDNVLYEYDIINVRILGTDISTSYTTFTSNPTIELNNVPLGSNLLEIELLTNEGYKVCEKQFENIFVYKPNDNYINNYEITIDRKNDNVINSKVSVEISNNIEIVDLESIVVILNNNKQIINDITNIDNKYEFVVNGLIYDNNELIIAFMNSDGYYITPSNTISKLYYNRIIDAKMIKGVIKVNTSEGIIYNEEEKDNNIIVSNRPPSLNGTNLEDITILDDDNKEIKIITKVDNVYYLTRDVTWYDIVQVTSINDKIKLYDGQIFDGNGFTIDMSVSSSIGIILSMSTSFENPAIIRNLGVLNGTLSTSYSGYIMCQLSNNFILENSYSTGTINKSNSGGLLSSYCAYVMNARCLVRNCYSTGNITGSHSGGICGSYCGYDRGYIEIDSCYSTGDIISNYSGGICASYCGYYRGGTIVIKNCISYNRLVNQFASGITGYNCGYRSGGTVIVQNSYFAGTVENTTTYYSGIFGYFNADNDGIAIAQNCYTNIIPKINYSIFINIDYNNMSARAMQLCYGNTDTYANKDSYTNRSDYFYPNYNTSKITGDLDKINNSIDYTYNGTQYNSNYPYFNSYGITVRNEGNAYVVDDNLPLLRSFIESSYWDTTNYNNYNDKPQLIMSSIIAEQTNYRIGGCDIKFDLIIPDELYSSVKRFTVETLDGELYNSYDVDLTTNTYQLLLKNTTYKDYDVLIKLYDSDNYYLVEPHKLYVVSIKPDGLSVPSINKIIAENDTNDLIFNLTSTNPSGLTIQFEILYKDELISDNYTYDGSYGKVIFNKTQIIYRPYSDVYGNEIINYIAREKETNLPSDLGKIDIYIDAAPVSIDKQINITLGDTKNVVFDATDPQNGLFDIVFVDEPKKGTLTRVNDLTYTYVSDGVNYGEDIISYRLSDNYSTTKLYYTYIQINDPNNSLSVAQNGKYTCERGRTVNIDLFATDTDLNRSTYNVTVEPIYGTINKKSGVMKLDLNNNYKGTLEYRASQDFIGTDIIKYVVNDGVVDSLEGTIEIICKNTVPVASSYSITTIQDVEKTFILRGIDINNDILVYSVTDPSNGTITNINGNNITYKPNTNYVGTDRFTYTISDGVSTSNIGVVDITIESQVIRIEKINNNLISNNPTLSTNNIEKIQTDITEKIVKFTGVDNLLDNYTELIFNYREGATIKTEDTSNNQAVTPVSVNKTIKEALRKEVRNQLNDFGFSSLKIKSTSYKNRILESANSIAEDINPVVYKKDIVVLMPEVTTTTDDSGNSVEVPSYDLEQINIEEENLYFDIVDKESINLKIEGITRTFTYNIETDNSDNILDDYLEDDQNIKYRVGDSIIINGQPLFILGLGSVLISNGNTSTSSGDPYISTLTNKVYKMKEEPGVYRMFDGDNITINAEVDWINEKHKEKIIKYFNGLENVVTDGILYKYLYIENHGEKLVIDFTTRNIHTNSNNKTIKVGNMYNGYSKTKFYRTIKCKKVPILIKNNKHGMILFTIELHDNPQIDSGLSIQIEKYKLSEITGLLVDTFIEKDMKLDRIDCINTLRGKTYKTEEKKHIIEKHETWCYM
jgi:hypothetical protein